MKKIGILLLLLTACSVLFSGNTVRLAATTAPIAAIAKAVTEGIPGMTVEQVVPASAGCPHDYALTPADVRKLTLAEAVILNGLGMDDAFRKDPKKAYIDSSLGVKNLLHSAPEKEENHHEHHGHHGHHGHHHEEDFNEHLFAAPSTAAEVTRSIARQLAALYPGHREKLLANGERYAGKLEKIAKEYRAFGKSIPPERRSICAGHNIFAYLCRDAGLSMDFVISPHDAYEPSAREVLDLIRSMKKAKTCMIAVERQGHVKAADTLSRELRIPVIAFRVQPDQPDPEMLLRDMRENLNLLKQFYGEKR